MAVDRDQLPEGIGLDADAAGQLCRELELAGVQPLLALDSDCMVSGGVTLSAPRVANDQFRQQVVDINTLGLPLSVSIPADCDDSVFEILGEIIGDKLEIVVNGAELSRERLLAYRDCLDRGILHLGVGNDVAMLERTWSLRGDAGLRLSYNAHVLPVSPLLSAEVATAVLPVTHIQVPVGTAWLPVRADLRRFLNERGYIRESELEEALCRCIEICDRLHGQLRWPTPQMCHDAWLNRRLAIVIDGIGDLVAAQGLDPGSFKTLQMVGRLLERVQHVTRAQSRLIAERTQSLPALADFDPGESLPGGRVRSSWRRQWRDAVALAGLRHRNLIVLSPWALFPKSGPADYRYADLLPLLRFANACAMGETPELSGWNAFNFKTFHRRAMAVLQQRITPRQIAERI